MLGALLRPGYEACIAKTKSAMMSLFAGSRKGAGLHVLTSFVLEAGTLRQLVDLHRLVFWRGCPYRPANKRSSVSLDLTLA